MAENLNLKLTVEAWADIVIREWQKKIETMNIGVSSQLIESFMHTVYTQADGDPYKVQFAFNYYGKFVDMGVGRGVPLDERDTLMAAGLTSRKPKPWYTEVFGRQLAVLRHILEEKHARKTEMFVVRNFDDNADLGFTEVDV